MQQDIPLVMVHGLFGPLHFFQPSRRMSGVAVHTPDMLGYGAHAAPGELSLAVQANEIVRFLRALDAGPCHLLGHSVGGAVAMLAAELAPQLVESVISVEGNFTLDDAFMCRRIAPLPTVEWEAELQCIQNQPADWLAKGGIAVTTERLQMTNCILHNQSAATLQAMARAVVKETADQAYLNTVCKLMKYGTPLHLVAGSRSAENWNVPEWVRQGAASSLVLTECGHMMMLEDPDLFCNSLLELLYS
jgi:pimeloyl-ACP methyl ester carboxylesterase